MEAIEGVHIPSPTVTYKTTQLPPTECANIFFASSDEMRQFATEVSGHHK